MLCPNCGESLIDSFLDRQEIMHCSNCGGTFFDHNGINEISYDTAMLLAKDKKYTEVSGMDKLCPKDKTNMVQMDRSESVPPNVTVFTCPNCNGVFCDADELVKYKKAHKAKFDYFKIWNIPLPSIRTISFLSIAIFISVVAFTAFIYFQKPQISQSRADDLLQIVYTTSSNRYIFVTFKTVIPLSSKIIFYDTTTGQTIEKNIGSKPQILHQITTTDLNPSDQINYQIILTDQNGKESKTEIKKLELK